MKKKLLFIIGLFMLLGLGSISSTFNPVHLPPVGCLYHGLMYQVGESFIKIEDGRLIQYMCNKDGNFVCWDIGAADGN